MDTPLKAALAYVGRGWSVIPVGQDKKPIGEWKRWQTTRMSRAEAKGQFSAQSVQGVAVVCGQVSGLEVLDFDGEAGRKALSALEPLVPSATPRTRTGSGGVHLYFKLCPGQRIKAWFWQGAKAGELRGEGGYVVAPPSPHPSGKLYRWLVEPTGPLAPMPDALRAAIFPPPAPRQSNLLSNPDNNQIGRIWLERAITRANSGNRNNTGFWLACQLRDRGLSQNQAEPWLQEYALAVGGTGQHPYTAVEALASLTQAYGRSPRNSQGESTYTSRVLNRFRRLP